MTAFMAWHPKGKVMLQQAQSQVLTWAHANYQKHMGKNDLGHDVAADSEAFADVNSALNAPLQTSLNPPATSTEAIAEAVEPTEPAAELTQEHSEALDILHKAQHKLASYHSLRSQVKQVIMVQGQKRSGEGIYLQGPQMQHKLQLHMDAGTSTGDLKQVCDGHLLWTETRLGPIPADLPEEKLSLYLRVERRNVERVRDEAINVHDPDQRNQWIGLGVGGLPAFLASLESTFNFVLLPIDQHRGMECLVLQGTWKPEMHEMCQYLKKKRKSIALDCLPTRITVYLETNQLFPVKYVYYHKTAHKTEEPLLVVEYSDIIFNTPLETNDFVYHPPEGYYPIDVTKDYLEKMKAAMAKAHQANQSVLK